VSDNTILTIGWLTAVRRSDKGSCKKQHNKKFQSHR